MTDHSEKALTAKYHTRFGRVAGYLPRDREAVDGWQCGLTGQEWGYFSHGGSSRALVVAAESFTRPKGAVEKSRSRPSYRWHA